MCVAKQTWRPKSAATKAALGFSYRGSRNGYPEHRALNDTGAADARFTRSVPMILWLELSNERLLIPRHRPAPEIERLLAPKLKLPGSCWHNLVKSVPYYFRGSKNVLLDNLSRQGFVSSDHCIANRLVLGRDSAFAKANGRRSRLR